MLVTVAMPGLPNHPVAKALYLNAALLAAILVVLLMRSGPGLNSVALAQQQPPIAGGAGVFIMPAQFHSDVWGCYLLDVDAQTICTYEYTPGEHQLRLTSARNYRYDRLLKDFATTPAPWEVEQMVERERQMQQHASPAGQAPSSVESPTGGG